MNVKKTIASIAAIAMVASATSLAPLFTGTTIAADSETVVDETNNETPVEETEETPNGDVTETEDDKGSEDGEDGEGGSSTGTGGSGEGDGGEGEDGKTEGTPTTEAASKVPTGYNGLSLPSNSSNDIYGVTATEEKLKDTSFSSIDESIGRTTEGYYLGFHVDALDISKNGSTSVNYARAFTYVSDLNDDTIKGLSYYAGSSTDGQFWACMRKDYLTPTNKTDKSYLVYAIKANYGDSEEKYYYIAVKWDELSDNFVFTKPCSDSHTTEEPCAVCGNTKSTLNPEPVTPPEEEDPPIEEDPTEPTDAEKVDTVKTELEPDVTAAKDSWNFEGKTHEEAEAIVRDWFASQGYEFAENVEIVFNWQEENGGVWIGFNITFGDEHEYGLGAWKNYTAPVVVVPSEPAPSGPVYYYPSVSYNPVNSSAGTVQTVSTSAQISAYKQKEVTIDASKTDVTPAMVKAFIKNKNIKTLTLKYSSSLKISIDKANITDASANFDFSVSGKNFLSAKQLKKIKGEKIVQLDFVNKGKLDGVEKAAVKVRVGANYIGKTVTIYEYKDGKLVKVGKAKVNGAGIVKFNTNRLSQFVLAVE